MEKYLLILAGAGTGGMLRYLIGSAITQRVGTHFPYGTIAVNVSGCFLIGAIMTMLEQRNAPSHWGFLLVTGLLGGYTTFSTFGWETYVLIREGLVARAAANALISVATGVLAVWGGVATARLIR